MKHFKICPLLVILLVGLLMTNCSSDDTDDSNNNSPGIFSANTVDTTFDGATIEWTESIDPDGDNITYAIILDDVEIASGGTTLTYSFSNLEPETNYEGYVEARDGNGGTNQASFFFTTDPEVIIRTLDVQWRTFIEGEGQRFVSYFEIPEEVDAISYSVVVTEYSINTIPATVGRTYFWTPDDILPTGNNVGTGGSQLTEFSSGIYHANTNVSGVNIANTSGIADLTAFYSAITGTAEVTITIGSNE